MFKNHPKGLYVLALVHTIERFGLFTMLATFTLFLQAKFGFTITCTSTIFGVFIASINFTPLIGGIIADRWWGYGKTITVGILVMFVGYLLVSFPINRQDINAIPLLFFSLLMISLGTGLFKGNLQVLIGNLYDIPKYKNQRDNAFSIFYMAANVGALFAPIVAEKVSYFFLSKNGLTYNAKIPALAHQFLNGTIDAKGITELTNLAISQSGLTDLTAFSSSYINNLSDSYSLGFGVACLAHIIPLFIYLLFKKTYQYADYNSKQLTAEGKIETILSPKQTKERIIALVLVYSVVIFFWMAFNQEGLTLTFFARDYTANTIKGLSRIDFDTIELTFIILATYSLFGIFQSKTTKGKLVSESIFVISIAALYIKYSYMDTVIIIGPELFQQFNPFFVVILTPFSLLLFGHLAKKKKEPSAPRKIGIGMIVAALGFLIIAIGSLGLEMPAELETSGGVSDILISPNWLIGTYFTLTCAELLLSPIGISFVSKVAPPQYKGLMMGGWSVSSAIGCYLVSFSGYLWGETQLWIIWGIVAICCLLAALFIFSIMKRLEKSC